MNEPIGVDQLNALPDGSVVWYWITWDGVEIHQILQKHGNSWHNANDPDDDHSYTPEVFGGDIYLLRRGWSA